jgi:hypothetical protein
MHCEVTFRYSLSFLDDAILSFQVEFTASIRDSRSMLCLEATREAKHIPILQKMEKGSLAKDSRRWRKIISRRQQKMEKDH